MLKIANPELIETAKREMIERIKEGIDLSGIRRILEQRHNLTIGENIEVSGGDTVVHENSIAFKLDLEILLSMSVLFDSEGNFIPTDEIFEENIDELGDDADDIIQRM